MKPIWIFNFGCLIGKSESRNAFGIALCALWSSAEAQQTEAKVPPLPVRAEISLSNSEQQPLPNQHKYKFRTQLTHDLPVSPCG
jgi:hypothetical protein